MATQPETQPKESSSAPPPPPAEAAPPIVIPEHLRPNEYETIYILRPDIDPDMGDRIGARVAEVIDRYKGTLVKVENWGKRRLAYPVAKQQKAFYIFTQYLGYAGLVQELERNLSMFDTVVKFQTVRIGRMVDPGVYAVKPEDVQWKRIEHLPETETERADDASSFERREEREFLEGTLDEPPLPDDEPAEDDAGSKEKA